MNQSPADTPPHLASRQPLLIDHTQLTDPALVHLFPLRLVQVDWLDPARRGARTVFFLYRHFHGGWAVGSVPGSADSGELVPSGLALRAVRDGRLDEAGARRLFETLLAGQAGLSGGRVWCTELPHLPLAVELRLAQAWVRPALPPVANQPRGIPEVQLYLHLCQGMRAVLPSAEADDLATWLGDLYSDTEGQMPLGLLSNEAHLWAFVLTETALSQQDGLADALRVLQRQGASAFCALMDQEALALMVKRLTRSCLKSRDPVPRGTVADVVQRQLTPFVDLLLEHWNVRSCLMGKMILTDLRTVLARVALP